MKIVDVNKIVGHNKRRDFMICHDWLHEAMTDKEVAAKYGIQERRVRQILIANKAMLKIDRNFEKTKRVQALMVSIKKSKESKKDRADLIEQLRKEIEGNSPVVDNSKHTHVYITKEEAIDRTNRLKRTSSREIAVE